MRIKLVSLSKGFDPSKIVFDHVPVIEKSGKFSEYGVFSEKIFGRLPSSGREYSCDCGAIEGRPFSGMICKRCDTEVVCKDTVFSKRGWVDLNGHQIISPLFYIYFTKVIGPSQLNKIITQKKVLTVNGIAKPTTSSNPYENIGLKEFAEKWPEILDYYEAKKKNDPKVAEYAALIRANPDKVMTAQIPVFNHILRPALVVDKKMIFDEVNNLYNMLVSNSSILRDYSPEEATVININAVLSRIQEKSIEVFNHVLYILSGKGGYLRGDLLGVRINFSARCVITPLGIGYEQDEVVVPYLTFLELYRFQLINLISKIRGVSKAVANKIWNEAQTKFDKSVYAIMKELIKRGSDDGRGLPALLNRNPSIAFGSILRVRIVAVKNDPDDYTLSIHNGILKLIAGDFDGDVVSLIPLLDRDLDNAFKIYDPRLMAVSRDSRQLNRSVTLDKDHVLGLSVLTEDIQFTSIAA
jgi:DNA-directed RNA polymerase beta' subunit